MNHNSPVDGAGVRLDLAVQSTHSKPLMLLKIDITVRKMGEKISLLNQMKEALKCPSESRSSSAYRDASFKSQWVTCCWERFATESKPYILSSERIRKSWKATDKDQSASMSWIPLRTLKIRIFHTHGRREAMPLTATKLDSTFSSLQSKLTSEVIQLAYWTSSMQTTQYGSVRFYFFLRGMLIISRPDLKEFFKN